MRPSAHSLLTYDQGSTGIQIVTALQARVKMLTHLIRDKTWLPPPCSIETLLKFVVKSPDGTGCKSPLHHVVMQR